MAECVELTCTRLAGPCGRCAGHCVDDCGITPDPDPPEEN